MCGVGVVDSDFIGEAGSNHNNDNDTTNNSNNDK